ncbi:SidA/IucD/PvdA family monooxygenase [Streptomyces pacificus]|uniref:L-lysine N6-monooxygenase MbtG n=1 Tax=Streptomyces pacificus TaxID=2705029 RepID=A0A6A0ATS9_9ACTN|nr:SidA/IucD/PvdA family monooxygenase [Streptomyces pacificus]GFH35763.1 SidA/IucD/PvdA family monooxygenase [Streptomyces pacificus]
MSRHDADIIGVGFGPGNISLAVALQERYPHLRAIFLESRPGPTWQSGMLIDGSDIQNNPVRDLVTPANPRSRFSFINYLHETGRFFTYLNLGLHYPLRKEYAAYVEWVARTLDADVRYDTEVTGVRRDSSHGGTGVVELADGTELRAPVIVAAPGRTPHIPAPFADADDPRVVHFTHYNQALEQLEGAEQPQIAVVGGSQSAVELLLDLRSRLPQARVHGILRSFGFRQKDTSPFMDHVYFPEFVDYYYAASESSKRDLNADLRYTNYSAADIDVVHELYLRLHEDRLDNREHTRVIGNTLIDACRPGPDAVRLSLTERHTGDTSELAADLVILATGFRDLGSRAEGQEFLPPLLHSFEGCARVTQSGRAAVTRDYRLAMAPEAGDVPQVYLNGLCESSHGMGDAGSFSLLALRAKEIASSIAAHLEKQAGDDSYTYIHTRKAQ